VDLFEPDRGVGEASAVVVGDHEVDGGPLGAAQREPKLSGDRVEVDCLVVGAKERSADERHLRGMRALTHPSAVAGRQGEGDLGCTDGVGAVDAEGECLVPNVSGQRLARGDREFEGPAQGKVGEETEVRKERKKSGGRGFPEPEDESAVGGHGEDK
jgi:hypothetical protein